MGGDNLLLRSTSKYHYLWVCFTRFKLEKSRFFINVTYLFGQGLLYELLRDFFSMLVQNVKLS